MARIFSFEKLNWASTDCEKLQSDLHAHYNMPTSEWWTGADSRFGLLRKYFELNTETSIAGETSADLGQDLVSVPQPREARQSSISVDEVSASSGEEETTDGKEASPVERSDSPQLSQSPTKSPNNQSNLSKSPAIPRVNIFKADTFLTRLTSTCEPLICQAFGSPNATRFEDIFWERIIKIKAEQNIQAEVISIEHGTGQVVFFMRFDGYDFKLRYLQWRDLVTKYPNVLDVPTSFLEQAPESMRSPVAQILNDEQTSKQLEKDDCRLAYYYIRGWAMNRGMFTRKQNRTASYISPSCIVSWITKTSDPIYQGLLSASGQRIDNQSAYLFSKYTFQFFEQFSKEYASIGSPLLSKQPYVEDTAHDWVDLLENLRTLSVEKKLDCPLYLRIDAVITGSSVNGGEWLRKVESRLDVLHADILTATKKAVDVHPWDYRVVAAGSQSKDTYEGFYIFGLLGPRAVLQGDLIDEVTMKWRDRFIKPQAGERMGDFQTLNTKVLNPVAMGDNVYVKDTKMWPHTYMKPPEIVGSLEALDLSRDDTIKDPKHHQNAAGESSKSLRTAMDVINRLKYNPTEYNIDEWIVGYKDRHKPEIQEKPVRNWATDITDETFIPFHRVEHFKHCPEGGEPVIMWDKGTKTDRIFTHQKGNPSKDTGAEESISTKRERRQNAKAQKGRWKKEAESSEGESKAKKITGQVTKNEIGDTSDQEGQDDKNEATLSMGGVKRRKNRRGKSRRGRDNGKPTGDGGGEAIATGNDVI